MLKEFGIKITGIDVSLRLGMTPKRDQTNQEHGAEGAAGESASMHRVLIFSDRSVVSPAYEK